MTGCTRRRWPNRSRLRWKRPPPGPAEKRPLASAKHRPGRRHTYPRPIEPEPSSSIHNYDACPLRNEAALLGSVSRRQDFVGIHPDDQIDNLIRSDFAEPMRRVRWNDGDISRSHLAAHAIMDDTAARARAVENFDDSAIRR